ncbi:hypothetical protein PM8797T_05125 [Gimesia maris DSM 8797]|nr:hypothetical protein PM8797T_05125 [Gimesia maris DSM 8797]
MFMIIGLWWQFTIKEMMIAEKNFRLSVIKS